MPTDYVKSLAKKHNVAVSVAESKWNAAIKQATKQNKSNNYGYVTSIFKQMMKESTITGLKDYIMLSERRNREEKTYDRAPAGDRNEFKFGTTDTEEMDDIEPPELDDDYSDESDDIEPPELDDDDYSDESDEYGDIEPPELDDDYSDESDESDDYGDIEPPELDDDHGDHILSRIVPPGDMEDDYSEDYDDKRNYGDEDFDDEDISDEDFDDEDLSDEDLSDEDLSDEDLSDEDLSDEDFDDEDFDGEDDGEDPELKRLVSNEGHQQFSMLKSLLSEGRTKKKKNVRRYAKSVYHRDYEKTKNMPYRHYQPSNVREGMWDYVKGAGQETANKARQFSQPIRDIHAAGKRSSAQRELTDTISKLVKAIGIHRNIKRQLSQTNEGMWDYVKGAGQETANKARQFSQPIRDIHAAGKRSSAQSDLDKYQRISNRLFDNVVQLMRQVGPDSARVVSAALKSAPAGIRLAIYNKIKRLNNPKDSPSSYTPGIQARPPQRYSQSQN
jgi:hypothetical protein